MVSTPLKNMKVSWDYYSQYMEKIKNVPNHQPVWIIQIWVDSCSSANGCHVGWLQKTLLKYDVLFFHKCTQQKTSKEKTKKVRLSWSVFGCISAGFGKMVLPSPRPSRNSGHRRSQSSPSNTRTSVRKRDSRQHSPGFLLVPSGNLT